MGNFSLPVGPPFETTIARLLQDSAAKDPGRALLIRDGKVITIAQLHRHALSKARFLMRQGIGIGDTVVTMLSTTPAHAALLLGCSLAGAVLVPLNPSLKGPSLAHAMRTAAPDIVVATSPLISAIAQTGIVGKAKLVDVDCMTEQSDAEIAYTASPDDIRSILFTSGTSGPPKGVKVTERMLVASAAGAALASQCAQGDTYLLWEPLHHIGGGQILAMALMYRIRLVMVERFSASRFWDQVRQHEITKLHYLGGILEILLKAAPSSHDRDHPIRLAFGGGCRPSVWESFQTRFGIPIREVYGMTEASSFTTINADGPIGSIGRPVPWMEVQLADEDGAILDGEASGEIVVKPSHPGLLTPGYQNAPEATARLLRGGRLYSGDRARRDKQGYFHFEGRITDSLRRRGENISAWEVETVLARHPDIVESAIVGVPAEIGEHEIMAFVRLRPGAQFVPNEFVRWCSTTMPAHHIPRYWKLINDFQRTPSQRIRKDRLDRSLAGALDTAGEQE